jgi:hypothetical protein
MACQLTGPLPPDTSWQAGDDTAFDLTRFRIDYDARQVVCPRGKTSRNWQPARSRDGLPIIRATFRQPDCRPCPDRSRCTRSQDNARHVTFLPAASSRPSSGSGPSRPPPPGANAMSYAAAWRA